ncbi:hypothetical protein HAX54_022718, partial [Datura stramonium]|nr:hypothetical protein [Datura stramonium]
MAPKGKEVIVAEKSRNRGRPRKMKASSSASKEGPTRRLKAKAPERCNLTLVREFYAKWDTTFGESTK